MALPINSGLLVAGIAGSAVLGYMPTAVAALEDQFAADTLASALTAEASLESVRTVAVDTLAAAVTETASVEVFESPGAASCRHSAIVGEAWVGFAVLGVGCPVEPADEFSVSDTLAPALGGSASSGDFFGAGSGPGGSFGGASDTLAPALAESAEAGLTLRASVTLALALTETAVVTESVFSVAGTLAPALTDTAVGAGPHAFGVVLTQAGIETAQHADNAIAASQGVLEYGYTQPVPVYATQGALEYTNHPLNEIQTSQVVLEVILAGEFEPVPPRPNHSFIRAYMATGHKPNASFSG